MTGAFLKLVGRLAIVLFCWTTALYAFLASSPFAYLQFLKPRVFKWVGVFSDTHQWTTWIAVGVFVAICLPDVRRGGITQKAAALITALVGLVAVWNTWRPVLPSLTDGSRSLVVGIVAFVPVLGLAMLDHVAARDRLRTGVTRFHEDDLRGAENRLFVAALGSAMVVVLIYAAFASVALMRSFEPDLFTSGLAVAIAIAILDHAFIFIGAFLVLALIGRIGHRSFVVRHLLMLVAVSLVFALLFRNVVGDSIGMSGLLAGVAAFMAGTSIAATWAGISLRRSLLTHGAFESASDVFIPRVSASNVGSLGGLVLLVPLAYALIALATRMDWDFALLKTGVVVVWVLAFMAVCRVTPASPRVSTWMIATVVVSVLTLHTAVTVNAATAHVLDRYAVHNPSFMVADGLLRDQVDQPSFDRYLRANTGLTDLTVAPVSIDFVTPLAAAPDPPPHIFLFVIDSLRPDYLSPYNPNVTFTPRIAEFARSNVTLQNAFTRYGGTGLSMPAIWSGSAIVHKQYVEPFASMNALEKLVDANGYRRVFSRDHITTELWSSSVPTTELDRGRTEMDFDFCRTLDELSAMLRPGTGTDRPIFAQTRSLTLHVASVRNGYVPPGKTYPGFEPPYAWRVERMDACFGGFIDRLKALNLYDRSLVVLTADHGELIGEDGRWGHSYHMFPEVIQIPLMMHLPASMRDISVDRQSVALSTDITPTIYAALGYRPQASNDLMGRSLIDADKTNDAKVVMSAERRRGAYVLAASYGAVYSVISGNGRRLYIADAIKNDEHAYVRTADGKWHLRPVDEGTRIVAELRIRRYVDEIARLYQVERRF